MRSSTLIVTLPPVVMLMIASQPALMRGRNCMNTAGSGEGRPSFGSRACRCRIAAPALAASIACVAIWSGVNGSAFDMVGVWIEPVIAQVITTLLASWGMGAFLKMLVVRARFLEMLHDLGTQRGLLLGAPLAEALARFETELALRHQPFEIGRRAGPAVDVGQHGLVDGESQIGSDEIGILQRPEHRKPAAERSFNNRVNGFGIANATLNQRNGFTPERMLQAVADEPWHVFLHMRRLLAGRRVQLHRPLDRLGRCPLRADHLDQRHQVWRVPPMGAKRA